MPSFTKYKLQIYSFSLHFRLCGSTLDRELPAVRSELVSKIWSLLQKKKMPLTTVHYNALLRVHLENGHKFSAEEVLADMRQQGAGPDKETYQCLISRHCQDGDIEGAHKVLMMMKTQGITINENIFNSLILGHGEAGELARSHGMLRLMKQSGLAPSQETFLTLACAYAKHGDMAGVERVMAESEAAGAEFSDGDYLELVFILSESGQKEQVGRLLAFTHPETEEFSRMASHLVVRLVNSGHDDVAYSLVQYNAEQSCEEGGRLVSEEFLEQIVRVGRPVTKLLWLVHDMADKKLMSGGLDKMVDIALQYKNFALSYKLADILLSEGGKIEERVFSDLLKIAVKSKSDEDILSCAKFGRKLGFLTADILKKQIFPNLENWPELVVTSLEEAEVGREVTVTPMVEWLIGQGKTEAAGTVAGIFSEHVDSKLKFLTSTIKTVNTVCNHFHEPSLSSSLPPPAPTAPSAQPESPPPSVNISSLGQQELEELINCPSNSPGARGQAYLRLLEMFATSGAVARAIQLAERLQAEENLHLPQFFDMFGCLVEPLLAQQPPHYTGLQTFTFNPHINQFVPMPLQSLPQPGFAFHPVMFSPGQPQPFYPPPAQVMEGGERTETDSGMTTPSTPSNIPLHSDPAANTEQMSTTPRLSVSGTTTPSIFSDVSEYNYEANVLHRQLKRSLAAESPSEGLEALVAMESLGKTTNVTETSALIEQLIRAEMMMEASNLTKGMLVRNTHPLPKIFRFLLNKLAVAGSVEEILELGQLLPTKIKKDVSFDNRLCNAYLAAGRGREFLEMMIASVEQATVFNDPEQIARIKDQFPRGGAMGLLDSYPELLDRYTTLAVKFATIDYVAPMNVLWTYHFINGNSEIAESIWQNYVKNSNQIMFQKVCQVARSTGNTNLAFDLVRQLAEADQVTSGARGIAYSCLLDCLCISKRHKEAFAALQEALEHKVTIEDINRTALLRLKQGLEDEGEVFPIRIPPKNSRRDYDGNLTQESSRDWNELC